MDYCIFSRTIHFLLTLYMQMLVNVRGMVIQLVHCMAFLGSFFVDSNVNQQRSTETCAYSVFDRTYTRLSVAPNVFFSDLLTIVFLRI